MNMFPTALRPLYDNAIGDRIRTWLGIRPPINLRPLNNLTSVSDLFIWRNDSVWQTSFQLVNLPSFFRPDAPADDHASIVLYASDGRLLASHEFRLAPFESRRLDIGDLLGDATGIGTFACFHSSAAMYVLKEYKCHLSDRGYVGYRRTGDKLWSYVHGNLHVLARGPNSTHSSYLGRATNQLHTYRPQVRLDDAEAFDLAYVNPVDRPLDLNVRFFDERRKEVSHCNIAVPTRGSIVISETAGRGISRVESSAHSNMWRPIIFLHYKSHFNVFHG